MHATFNVRQKNIEFCQHGSPCRSGPCAIRRPFVSDRKVQYWFIDDGTGTRKFDHLAITLTDGIKHQGTVLSQERFDDVAMHVGQPIISSLKSIGQFGMVKAEQMHPGRLQIVNVDRILRNRES